MWTRKSVKERGKGAFKRNYWKAVLIAVILAIVAGSGSSVGSNVSTISSNAVTGSATEYKADKDTLEVGETVDTIEPTDEEEAMDVIDNAAEDGSREAEDAAPVIVFVIVILVISITIMAVALLIDAFILNPMELGCNRFFYKNLDEDAKIANVVYAFDHGYKNIAKTMFMRDVYIVLWSLLFIIPGIVKEYEYRMVPYILAENPDMDRAEVFAESKRLMKGNKWKAFVLDLSFIGWDLLSVLTCGLLSVFYVNPYKYSTNAALYETLRYGNDN